MLVLHNVVTLLSVLAIGCGLGIGLSLRHHISYNNHKTIFFLEFPGNLLMSMLNFMSVPLTLSGIVFSITLVGTKIMGKVIVLTVWYHVLTTFLSTMLGLIVAYFAKIGNIRASLLAKTIPNYQYNPNKTGPILDFFAQCFPDNLVRAFFETEESEYTQVCNHREMDKDSTCSRSHVATEPKGVQHDQTNFLGILALSVSLGCVINYRENQTRPLKAFFHSIQIVFSKLSDSLRWFAPFGVLFMTMASVVSVKDVKDSLLGLERYIEVTCACLFVHGFVVLPILYVLFTKRNPYLLALKMTKVGVTAWATASSSATLPLTINTFNRNYYDPTIVSALAPVTAILNNDAIAINLATLCIFIVQFNKIAFTFKFSVVFSLTITGISLFCASSNEFNKFLLGFVLKYAGLPEKNVYLLLAVDWMLYRFRALINVWGGCVCVGIFNHHFQVYIEDNTASFSIYESASSTSESTITPASSVEASQTANEVNDNEYTEEPMIFESVTLEPEIVEEVLEKRFSMEQEPVPFALSRVTSSLSATYFWIYPPATDINEDLPEETADLNGTELS